LIFSSDAFNIHHDAHAQAYKGWVWLRIQFENGANRSHQLCLLDSSKYGMDQSCSWCIIFFKKITTSESVRVCLCIYMCICVYTYIDAYCIYGHRYVYVYYIHIHILFFVSGGRTASCMMACARATYVLSHFSR